MDPMRRTGSEPRRSADDRFDDVLERVAHSLVSERLPHGVLDPAVSDSLGMPATGEDEGGSRRIPGFAVAGTALVVLLLAAATLAPTLLLPGGSPPTSAPSATADPSVTPTFRSTTEIRRDLVLLGYACVDGAGDAAIESGAGAAREAARCTAPEGVGPLTAAVIVGESLEGRVIEVRATAEIVGFDVPASRRSVASTMAKAVAVVVPEGLGNAVATWLANNVPVVEPEGTVTVELRGYALQVDRDVDGIYTLVVVSVTPA